MAKSNEKFSEKHKQLWEFIKFIFTAGSTTILYYAIYFLGKFLIFKGLSDTAVHNPILQFLGYDYNLGLAISYLSASFLSYVASYIMNRKLTFKSNSNIVVSTILFALMVVVTTAFTAWFGGFLEEWLAAKKISGALISVIAPTLAMLIPFVWTYPFQKFVIYRNKKEADETGDKEITEETDNPEE